MCKAFSTSLKGPMLTWYKRLPLWSIDFFFTLAQCFGGQYATSCPHHTTFVALVNLRQVNDKSLRSFMKRYTAISVRIIDLDPSVALHSLTMALKPRPFVDSLSWKQPKNLNKLRAQATDTSKWRSYQPFTTKYVWWSKKKATTTKIETHPRKILWKVKPIAEVPTLHTVKTSAKHLYLRRHSTQKSYPYHLQQGQSTQPTKWRHVDIIRTLVIPQRNVWP